MLADLNISSLELAEASPNPYVLMDRDLRLVWMNRAYLAATMRSRADIIDKPLFEVFPSDPASESYQLLDESLRHVLETGEADEIALIRYDIAGPGGDMQTRYWSATHTPFAGSEGRPDYILQHTVDVTELQTLRQMRKEMNLVQVAGAVQARNRDLERESQRLFEFFEQAPGFVAVLAGPEHVFQMTNAAYLSLVGRDDIRGLSVKEALPEVVEQGFPEVLDGVYRTGQPYFGKREPVVLHGSNDPAHARRVLNFIFQPIADGNGTVTGIIIQGNDVTEEVEYEERQELLIKELNHRVKNTLAVVQGLAQQTFRGLEGAGDTVATYKARLQALAAAHGLLTESNWSPARVGTIVELTVEAAFGPPEDRLRLEGPDFLLAPEVALALTMILHELTTNAIKYGALSNDAGVVTVSWTIARKTDCTPEDCGPGDCDVLKLEWRETGGPPVEAPSHEGFGSKLIRRGISSKRGTRVDLRHESDGVVCTIEANLEPLDH
ncbi:sensor histidine kinase [Alteriqipengyuania sp. 357]